MPLLIGGALGFSAKQLTYLVSIDIFMCGLATFLQLRSNRFMGIGLPVVLGCAVQAIEPLKMIGKNYSIGAMYGSIMVAGLVVILISGWFAKIKKLFPPVVTGSLITVIGLTLIPVAIGNLGGGDGTKDFGDPRYLLVGFITIAVILAINGWAHGFLRSIAVLIGLVVGTVVASFMGMVSLQPVVEASWFHFPQPFYFGTPKFEPAPILTMVIISLVSMVESTGVYFALGDIVDRPIGEEDLKKGYRAEGLAIILGGLFNTFPYTAFSQNVGLVQMSGIKTRKPIYFAAGFLVLLGLLPKAGALATIIPDPVLGGAMLVMFGMVAVQGMRMLQPVDFSKDKNLLIVATSISAGLGVTIKPEIFNALPDQAKLFLQNGIVVASLVAVILNLLFVKINFGEKKTKSTTN